MTMQSSSILTSQTFSIVYGCLYGVFALFITIYAFIEFIQIYKEYKKKQQKQNHTPKQLQSFISLSTIQKKESNNNSIAEEEENKYNEIDSNVNKITNKIILSVNLGF
eukprot:111183_1